MRILQVITRSCLGGAQMVVAHLCNALCREHEVAVVAGEGDGSLWELLDERVERIPCDALQRSLSLRHDFAALVALRGIYRRLRPDVVHLHSSKAGMLGRMVFPRRKIVYTVHGFDSIRLAFRLFLPVERLMQHRCAAIVGVSRHDVRTMAECGIRRNVSYIYNGVPEVGDGPTTPLPDAERFRRIVLCIARLSPPKKHDLFVATARRLPDYAFVWIGNQEEVADCPPNVFFMGSMPRASHWCHRADLFVLPSNYEGLPMVILEAMSCGLPVVASRVGGVEEVVRDGKNGYAVENTPEAFAEKIRLILESPVLHGNLSRQARADFLQDFTMEKMVQGYTEIYQNIRK